MKKMLALVFVSALLLFSFTGTAFAARQYIIPDSDARYLTTDELWDWDYESVGFIMNEIFARHGYCFESGQKYDYYFSSRPWYQRNQNSNNSQACYPKLNKVEWANEELCKEVRQEMRAAGTLNRQGKNYLNYVEQGEFDVLTGFVYTSFQSDQKFPVYSAPDRQSYRGAKGKAAVSTNGSIYVAGQENGWVLLMYETNNGAVRVGYAQRSAMKDRLNLQELNFSYQTMTCNEDVWLTDDPATNNSDICRISQGSAVTYLTQFYNRYAWAYVETMYQGQPIRGFIPADALDLWENNDGVEADG